MGELLLNDEQIKIIGNLLNVHDQQKEQSKKIELLETKLKMAKEAMTALTSKEKNVIEQLKTQNIYFGNKSTNNDITNVSQNQLTALLNTLLQQSNKTNNINESNVETSEIHNLDSNIINHNIIQSIDTFDNSKLFSLESQNVNDAELPVLHAKFSAPGLSIRKLHI